MVGQRKGRKQDPGKKHKSACLVWTDLADVRVWCEAQHCPAMTVRRFFGGGLCLHGVLTPEKQDQGNSSCKPLLPWSTVGTADMQRRSGLDLVYAGHYNITYSNSIIV